ncbi:glycosyltransferase family 61 protein [Thomasclavelia cocleata]|uniref:glycosyltransferase family 61 protein n=1 Tax=Thomasclavelia cocleata TaxID=69824 RepID=UPI0024315AC9|nr:glycosyltransferase family 61 protein [Thomasclavelia cocleata]
MNNYKYMDEIFLEEIRKMDSRNMKSTKKLIIESVNNGVIYPKSKKACGGVMDENSNFILLSKVDTFLKHDSFGGKTNNGQIGNKYKDIKVIYFGNFWKQWGHFLIDSISRLWVFLENDDYKDYIICYTGHEIDGIYKEFLELFGVDTNKLLHIEQAEKFKEILVPECSHMPGLYYTEEWKRIFDRVIARALEKCEEMHIKKHSNKIIFSRRNFLKIGRAPFEVGESNIVKLFSKNGYEIICPEEYSLIEQISIINNSNEIVSISGTLAHTMVFAKDGTKLIQLKKYPEVNYRQIEINQYRNLDVYNLDVHISPFVVRNGGPFVYDINKNIITYFKDHNLKLENKEIIKGFICRKVYMFYYFFVYFLFVRIIQRKESEPTLAFMKELNEGRRKIIRKKMKKYYLKKFFY